MKISKNWLNNYIVSNKTDEELVDDFTQLGLECTSRNINSIDNNIVVGKVMNCIKHPNADRLKVCEVDISENQLLTIVCGASNIKKNILVPLAKVGSKIGDFKIKKTKIRDVVSEGMICSEKELGISDEHEGIMILDSEFKKGQQLNVALSLKQDTIFDFDLTPNRGDCLSHIGISRELALLEKGKSKIKNYEQKKLNVKKNNETLAINISDNKKCKRYVACIIRNITVKKSPNWLKKSLESIGQKSINNIVDATNFILMDLGHPMHTFDLNKIDSNSINVRTAKKNETIVTLDNSKQKLNSDNLLICNGDEPIAIAGIIGGNNSEVDRNTKDILIESAYFDPISIRKSSKSLGISTEASKRFERDTDINMLFPALNKLALLIQNIAGGEISSRIFDIYDKNFKGFNDEGFLHPKLLRKISFNIDKCNNFLGTNISIAKIKTIFNSLYIDYEDKDGKLICIVPTFRNDLHIEVDLYEEVARVFGYNNIPANYNFNISLNSFSKNKLSFENSIRKYLSMNGLCEHYSNSFCSKDEIIFSEIFSDNTVPVQIQNPLSSDMQFLRTSLIPGILKALSFNVKRSVDFARIYEIGSVSSYNKKLYNKAKETRMLTIGCLGNDISNWKVNTTYDIFNIKTDIINMFKTLNKNDIDIVESISNLDKMDFTLDVICENKKVGNIFAVNNQIKKDYDIKSELILVNIDLELLSSKDTKQIRYEKPSPFPFSKRDIAILVDNHISHNEIENLIKQSSSEILKNIHLFDIYKGDKIDSGKKSLAYSLEYQSKDRTLKDDEIDKEIKVIISNLKNKLNAKQR